MSEVVDHSRKIIRVINPNSNSQVTVEMATALAPLQLPSGPQIGCVTLEEGPFGIETDQHVTDVIPLLTQYVSQDSEAAAFVIACYSDPGLMACREITQRPVFGIQNCAILAAMARGRNFGVVALSEGSIKRHLAYISSMGVESALAGERPLHMSVAEAEGAEAYPRILATATALKEQDGADCVILGCAGMSRHRARLEHDLGLPVIDPSFAAVSAALAAVITP